MQLRKVADRTGPEPRRNVRDEDLRDQRLGALGDLAADFSAEAKAALALPDPSKPQDALLEAWPLSHVEVVEAAPEENVARGFVERAVEEGWLSLERGRMVFHTKPRMAYEIVRGPGVFCCHCGQQLEGGNAIAQAHVADCAAGAESPDPENPAGYRVTDFYELRQG